MASAIALRAPAKINLTLDVLGKRPDGFHELRSVFATVDVRDLVRVSPARTLDVVIAPPLTGVAPGEDLASRAVRALARAAGREPAARVRVRKGIPVAAGLGGGSSDAAATLVALARLWRCEADLGAIGASVGSDVPFFVSGAPYALVGGRGGRVQPLPPPRPPLYVALVTLPAALATAEVFAALHDDEHGVGYASQRLADALSEGSLTPATARELAHNDLLEAAVRLCPAIADAREVASRRGVALSLSGSGPSLFAIADDEGDAIRIARNLRRDGLRARARRLG